VKRTVFLAATAAILSLTVIGLASGASSAKGTKLTATLTAAQEVPRQKVRVRAARGRFAGRLTGTGRRRNLQWSLSFSRLSGKPIAAHIHLGKPGKAGPVAVTLCAASHPCGVATGGRVKVAAKIAKAITTGNTYVNVHTKKNPNGEIRGQVRVRK
jgi:hypothetical protein